MELRAGEQHQRGPLLHLLKNPFSSAFVIHSSLPFWFWGFSSHLSF
jgi:hypothetical protein